MAIAYVALPYMEQKSGSKDRAARIIILDKRT